MLKSLALSSSSSISTSKQAPQHQLSEFKPSNISQRQQVEETATTKRVNEDSSVTHTAEKLKVLRTKGTCKNFSRSELKY